MKTSTDEQLSRRFYRLNAVISVVLLIAIAVSISQFGRESWGHADHIGFIMAGAKEDPGWNRAQATGIREACQWYGYDLMLRENVPVTAQDLRKTVRELADRGAKTIFFTNAYPAEEVESLAMTYPRIRFHGIDEVPHADNVRQYSVRYIELRYLSGLLAGLHTRTNRIGYVAPFACPEVNQGINAFALGVQKVNPEAQIFLVWTGDWHNPTGEEQAVHTLKAVQTDVLTYHQDSSIIPETAERTGMDFISYHESYPDMRCFLAGIKTHWGMVYRDILGRRGNQLPHEREGVSWGGFTQGRTDLELSKEKLTMRERAVLETERYALLHGKLVFTDEIYDRNGVLRCGAKEAISGEYLRTKMDWLVRGVNVIGY